MVVNIPVWHGVRIIAQANVRARVLQLATGLAPLIVMEAVRILVNGHLLYKIAYMEKEKQSEELQSRREFFKNAAKSVLPILGAVVLSSSLLQSKAAEVLPTGCNNSCYRGCAQSCTGRCMTTCNVSCKNHCRDNCGATCKYTCSGKCTNNNKL